MLTIHGLPDLRSRAGTDLGDSPWHRVTQERIDAFADATDDHTRLHVDPAYAATTRFGATIAHGLYTLSLGPKFLHEIYVMQDVSFGLNYGYDSVRWLQPVTVNSLLRMRAAVAEVRDVSSGLRVTLRQTFEIDGESRPACVADNVVVYYE